MAPNEMTLSELLAIAKAVLLSDSKTARVQLAQLLALHDDFDGAAMVRRLNVDHFRLHLRCGACQPKNDCEEGFETPLSFEEDDLGETVREEWVCNRCGQTIATIVYRPVCFKSHEGDQISDARPIWELTEFLRVKGLPPHAE